MNDILTDLTGGQALVGQLLAEGVTDLFGIPGVQLDWAVDAVREAKDRIHYFVPRHEQATSYMADGYARTTGREGVCMVVPGPGVLNALSGLATAYACNSPVLCIAGQLPSHSIGKELGLLHELPDQSRILKSLTKWHAMAQSPAEIPALVHEAFVQLRSGRPRPVAIEVPQDVLQASGSVLFLPRAPDAPLQPDPDLIASAAACLAKARFPVIQAGGGCRAANAGAAVERLAEMLQAPVIMTEGGRGTLSDRHPLALSSLGGRVMLPRADVVLVIGSRFVDGTGKAINANQAAEFIYINVEPSDMRGPRRHGVAINADARLGTESLLAALSVGARPSAAERVARVRLWGARQTEAIQPQTGFVGALRRGMTEEDILVSELTQVGYFANLAFPVYRTHRLITPGYQGTLGYGFSTALGAAVGNPAQRVVSINGDGGFGWGQQELSTLARYQLDLSVVVFADGHFGNVQRIQRRVFGAEFATEVFNPDFDLLGRSYGIFSATVDTADALEQQLVAARLRGGPALITVRVTEMPSPWALIHPFVVPVSAPPSDPLEGYDEIVLAATKDPAPISSPTGR